jgi:hypothetical protein
LAGGIVLVQEENSDKVIKTGDRRQKTKVKRQNDGTMGKNGKRENEKLTTELHGVISEFSRSSTVDLGGR